jgi:hypothetical protein
MPYTDQEIQDKAQQLADLNATDDELRAFINAAKAEQVGLPAPSPVPALATQWANAGPLDRAKMIASHFGGYAAKSANGLIDAGIEGAGPAIGQVAGEATGPMAPVAMPALGALGGAASNAVAQGRRIYAGDQANFSWGQVLGAGIAGANPGRSLAGAGAGQIAKTAGKYAAGNVAALAAQTGVDEGRLPSAGEAALAGAAGAGGALLGHAVDRGAKVAAAMQAEAQNAVRDTTLAEGRRVGYVVPPTRINPTFPNGALERFAGSADTAQDAVARNQEVTDALARRAIGVAPDAPLTESLLSNVRAAASLPYARLAAFSPAVAGDLEELKIARNTAKENFTFYNRSADPKALAAAKTAAAKADAIESQIEGVAISSGLPDLVNDLRAARVRIAKTYAVERALNLGDGHVDARVLGRMLDGGAPLSDELATVAKFQQAFPQAMAPSASTPTPGGKSRALISLAAGVVGNSTLGPMGALAAAIPAADGPTRSLILSRLYQAKMASPIYPGLNQPDFQSNLFRYATQAAGRQPSALTNYVQVH